MSAWHRHTRCYEVSGGVFRFAAGTYTRYNEFREALCRAVNGVDPQVIWDDPDRWANEPFFELINFANNVGTIGPVAAAALADDFDADRDRLLAQLDQRDQQAYENWRTAFQLAANTGMVVFR